MTPVIEERDAPTTSIILSHLPWMVRVARGLTGSIDEAEVLVQDTVVSVLTRRPRLEAPKAYLRTALVNTHLNMVRRRVVEAEHRTSPAGAIRADPAAFHAEGMAVRTDLMAALSLLSDLQRQVLTLRYLEDQTAPAVGKVLGRSAASVRRIASEAMSALRSALPHDYTSNPHSPVPSS